MSESANKHHDRLIEDALSLLRDAAWKEPSDVKNILPAGQFEAVETNIVMATQYPDGHRSVVAAASIEIVTAPEPEQPLGRNHGRT